MSEKKIARYVQKHIVKHNVVTTDEIFNYNTMMIELSNIKKQILLKDNQISQPKKGQISFQKDILNLCIEPFDFGTIETDAK
jgi:hypothetical protein